MKYFTCFIVATLISLLCWVPVRGEYNICNGSEDVTFVHLDCSRHIRCYGEVAKEHSCGPNQVMERNSLSCKWIGLGHTACGLPPPDCTPWEQHLIADTRFGCQSMALCLKGKYAGRLYCTPPTLFDQRAQTCKLEEEVTCASSA